ncbi:MAG: radical SAM protein [Spirochaetes bacterium]|nr:radical SAM protein [Spirochaetota bacterium]
MAHIFGPVRSRRLGLSLGVDIVPAKFCTCNCIYCESGKTTSLTVDTKPYVTAGDIIPELRKRLGEIQGLSWITFSGAGEPTLNDNIGDIIDAIKKETAVPVCVITNGTLLGSPEVRQRLMHADLVMPSYHTAIEATFKKIVMPHPKITLASMTEGLVTFSKEFRGKLWIEVLVVAGYNDTDEEMRALKAVISRVRHDAVCMNTVYRPPAFDSARPVDEAKLARFKEMLDA